MDRKIKEFEKTFGTNKVRKNEPMSSHSTFKIGGNAEVFISVDKVEDLIKAVRICSKLELPVFILGGGSNIIVSDKGIKGVVIKNNCRRFEVARVSGKIKNQSASWRIDVDKAFIYAESGVLMNQLVRFTIEQGYAGLEYQLGLPGTVGGAVFMNSNFPRMGQYVGDCLFNAKIMTKDGIVKDVDHDYFRFAYDKSTLQGTGEILLSAIFKLEPMDKKILWQRGMEALEYRTKTQPKGISAGCTFRNISISHASTIPTPNNITSAGYLIDKAGLKGKRVGDAMISNEHANFILNLGHAKAEDVTKLIDLMKEGVYKKFRVSLQLEVKTVGF